MNIGIYSGSFNPPHLGHAMMAAYISGFVSEIDRLWLLVSPHNPLKDNQSLAPFPNRLDMATTMADNIPGVSASDFENTLPLPSYTINTLQTLSDKYPRHHFTLIIGADNWQIFHRWRDHQEIISSHGVIIYPRPGYDIDTSTPLPDNVKYLSDAPMTDISSTFIRQTIATGHDMSIFLPPGVYDYIKAHNLYYSI